jgi:hypothetical protein
MEVPVFNAHLSYARHAIAGVLIVLGLSTGAIAATCGASAQGSYSKASLGTTGFRSFILVDSDGDGASDEAELAYGTDPNDSTDYPEIQAGPEDSDGDGASDEAEIAFGSDPEDPSDFPAMQAGPEPNLNGADVTALPSTGVGMTENRTTNALLLVLVATSTVLAAAGIALVGNRSV